MRGRRSKPYAWRRILPSPPVATPGLGAESTDLGRWGRERWLEDGSQAERREARAGSACQPTAAQAQSGHVALPAPGWHSPPQSVLLAFSRGLRRGHLTVQGVPALRTVLGLVCHVIDSHRRPEVACIASTEILAVVNVISPEGLDGNQGFTSCFRGSGTESSSPWVFVKII